MSDAPETPEVPVALETSEAEKKAAEYWDLLLRNKAEFENFKRRAERDLESAHKYSTEKLLQSLLPILDSMEQALNAFDAQNPHRSGVEMTLKLFVEVLGRFGIQVLAPEAGDAFNPASHEAIMMQEDAGRPGCILNVIQKGYQLYDRVVRPARVVVSKNSGVADLSSGIDVQA